MTTSCEKILVVDDDEAGRHIKTHILKRAGYSVTDASLGREAVRLTREDPPHLVLLDVKLPDISGIEVCRLIKASQPEVLVLQTSAAFVDSEHRARGLSGGADAYLIAPIESAELIASVGALLRLSRAERELRRLNETLESQVQSRTHALAAANEQLRAEMEQRRKAEETLLHAQKLDAIGQLTGGIAHDFNNLLTVIQGNFELLKNRLNGPVAPPKEMLLRFVEAGDHAARQCAYLTRQLLSFARRDALRLETVDVNSAIGRYSTLLARALGDLVRLDLALAQDIWSCRIDLPQLEAALLNLTVNARDAMPNGGVLKIGSCNVSLPAVDGLPAGVPLPKDITPGEYVVICFSDTGTGMTEAVLAHAFDPFFTTKDIGKGSGLGLSQVYGFIKQAGGAIGVDSALGRGTRIAIFLSRAKGAREVKAAPKEAPVLLPRGSETVLVVEDHLLVLGYVTEMLEELGYTVLQASDGPAALEIVRGHRAIDLLFTDVVMPRQMSGIDLAHQARKIRPDLKVLITSGYSASVADEISDEFRYVGKPYDIQQLAKRLREILAS